MTAALAAGLAAMVLAFVPSPLRLLDGFDSAPEIEVHAPPPLKLTSMPPISAYGGITARPIFNADRRPDPLTSARRSTPQAQPADADISEFRLVGIVTDSVAQRALIVRSGGPAVKVSPGDRLGGWRIEKIDPSGVLATSEGRSVKIVIPKSQPPAATP